MTSDTAASLMLSGVDVPSRTIIRFSRPPNGHTASLVPFETFAIIHFDDIRDAIDMVLRSFRDKASEASCRLSIAVAQPDYHKSQPAPLIFNLDASCLLRNLKMNQLLEVREVMFACTPSAEQHLKDSQQGDGELASASVMVTIAFDTQEEVDFEIVDPLVAEIERNFASYGPILAKSEVKRDIQTGSIFKFFAEFYRVQDCHSFLKEVTNVSTDHAKIIFEPISLYDVDREALFFTPTLTPAASSSAIEPYPPSLQHQRRDSLSSASNDEISSSISFDSNFEIDLWKIESGLEKRTTCMIRNIPNKYTQQMVLDLVNETHKGCFDFLYLRMDFRNRCNVGYAFINFTDPQHIVTFSKRVCGRRWARFNSDKICTLTFARIQGTEALIEKFRHSKVMFEPPAYRPKLFYVSGPLAGQEAPFPGVEN